MKSPSSGGLTQRANPSMMMPPRTESLAYPSSPASNIISRCQYFTRQHAQKVVFTLAFVIFVLVISSDFVHHEIGSSYGPGGLRRVTKNGAVSDFGGAFYPGYFKIQDAVKDDKLFTFAAVTDMDELSRVKDSKKPEWQSYLALGHIQQKADNTYTIEFEDYMRNVKTKHNEAGRGAEFSELAIFDDRLLTFDDRTGDVFEILNTPDGDNSLVVPRFVITEGSGDTDKGMKWEWATVKDGLLYMGSMGKEYTNPDGSIANTNNLWIATLDATGVLTRIHWDKEYNKVRAALGAESPGYVIHEAVNWSPYLRKWVFLPRRISSEKYDDVKDERKGSNKLVLVSEDFSTTEIVEINMANQDGLHGFSSFAFVPGTNDRHALATRSVEEDCVGGDDELCKQRTYFVIFDVMTGAVLMDEVQHKVPMKFEGVEFVDLHTAPPPH